VPIKGLTHIRGRCTNANYIKPKLLSFNDMIRQGEPMLHSAQARRALAVAAAGSAPPVAVALLHWGTQGALAAASAPGQAPLDALVAAAAALAAWLVLGWLVLALGVAVLAEAPGAVGRCGEAVAQRVTPTLLRRVARVALGVAVVGGPLVTTGSPALAASAAALAPVAAGTSGSGPLAAVRPAAGGCETPDRAWTPDRPAAASGRGVGEPRPVSPRRSSVVVRRGDTLWDIAASRLPPSASDAAVARSWPRWYATNRAAIGSNPDLLRPGTRLHPPTYRPAR